MASLYSRIKGTYRYLVNETGATISDYEYRKRNSPKLREMARVFIIRSEDKYGITYTESNVWNSPEFYEFRKAFSKSGTKQQKHEALNYLRDYENEIDDINDEVDYDTYGWVGF